MNGCWVVYDPESMAKCVYDNELDALREAVKWRGSAKFVPYGMDFGAAFVSPEEWQPQDEEPIPFIPTEGIPGSSPEEDIMRRITLPENHGMGPE